MAFGNYGVSFKTVKDTTLGEVFGTKSISPMEMTKALWAFVKKNKLGGKPEASSEAKAEKPVKKKKKKDK